MKLRSRPLALAAASLALLPTSALAQSAGDEQYADPFGSSTPQPQAPAAPAPAAPPSTSAPAPSATTAQSAPAPATAPAAAPATRPQLPRTGADAGLLALTGALLLASGAALRLRWRAE